MNKQVEKRIAELRSELLLMNHVLKVEMALELQEEQRESVPEEARERFLHYTKLDREQRMTRWLREMEEECKEKTEEDKEDEAKSLDLETLSFNFSTTDANSFFIMRKPPKCELEENLKIVLNGSSDADTSDADSSQPAKCEQEENQQIPSDGATVADTRQFMKESEEKKSSRSPFHANPSFMTGELRCEEERVQVAKEEAALLMDRQWKEWMDKQEIRGNHNKAKPVDQQNTEKQRGAAHPVSEKQTKQTVKEVDTMKKIKTYLRDLFNPHTFYKWERLEDED